MKIKKLNWLVAFVLCIKAQSLPCFRDAYKRGSGTLPVSVGACNDGLELSDGQCYQQCLRGFTGIQTWCWKECPVALPYICNTAICTADIFSCTPILFNKASLILGQLNDIYPIEDIVRNGVLASAGVIEGFCEESILEELDTWRALQHDCTKRRYPMFLGSQDSAITTFMDLDIDANGNICFAGQSNDQSIFSTNSPTLSIIFTGYLQNAGFVYSWVTEFGQPQYDIKHVEFSPLGIQMILMLSNRHSPSIDIIIQNIADGSVITSKSIDKINSNAWKNTYLAVNRSTGYIYIAAQEDNVNKPFLLGLNLFNDQNLNSAGYYFLSSISAGPTGLVIGPGSDFLYLTQETFSPGCPYNGDRCSVIAVFGQNYVASYRSEFNYEYMKFKIRKIAGIDVMFLAGIQEPTSPSRGIQLVKLPIITGSSPLLSQSYVYQENNDELSVADVYVFDDFKMYAFIINSARSEYTLLTVIFPGGSENTNPTYLMLQQRRLNKPSGPSTTFIQGIRILDNGEYFMYGSKEYFSSCIQGISGSSPGYIFHSDESLSCKRNYHNIGAKFSLSELTDAFTQIDQGSQSGSLGLSVFNINSVVVSQSQLYQVTALCCQQYQVTKETIDNQRYIIDYPPEIYNITKFVFQPNQCLEIPTFTYLMESSPPLPVSNTLAFDYIKFIFEAYSQDSSEAQAYSITLKGTLPNHQVVLSNQFTIQLFAIPQSTQVIGFQIPSFSYIVTDEPASITWQHFRCSDPSITKIFYYLEAYNSDTDTYSAQFDSSIFGFTQGQNEEEITVYTKNTTKVGIYKMRITGKLTPHSTLLYKSSFDVNILHQCYITNIIKPEIETKYEYVITNPISSPLIITIPEWKESLGICEPFTYRSQLSTGATLPQFIAFNKQTLQFVINQSPSMTVGKHLIKVIGQLAQYQLTDFIELTLDIQCHVGSVVPSQSEQSLAYIVGNPRLVFNVAEFIQTPKCMKSVIYEAIGENGNPFPTELLSFTDSQSEDGSHDMYITAFTMKKLSEYSYAVIVKGSIPDDNVSGQLKISFSVRESSQFTETTYPPSFIKMISGESTEINNDIDSSVSINVEWAKYFISYDQNNKLSAQQSQNNPEVSFD